MYMHDQNAGSVLHIEHDRDQQLSCRFKVRLTVKRRETLIPDKTHSTVQLNMPCARYQLVGAASNTRGTYANAGTMYPGARGF